MGLLDTIHAAIAAGQVPALVDRRHAVNLTADALPAPVVVNVTRDACDLYVGPTLPSVGFLPVRNGNIPSKPGDTWVCSYWENPFSCGAELARHYKAFRAARRVRDCSALPVWPRPAAMFEHLMLERLGLARDTTIDLTPHEYAAVLTYHEQRQNRHRRTPDDWKRELGELRGEKGGVKLGCWGCLPEKCHAVVLVRMVKIVFGDV